MTDARYIALPLISRYHCLDPTNRDISGLHCIGIPMLKIRLSRDHLIFNMGISIPGKHVFYIETGPWFSYLICWWLGNTKTQGISSQGVALDLVEYSWFSTRMFKHHVLFLGCWRSKCWRHWWSVRWWKLGKCQRYAWQCHTKSVSWVWTVNIEQKLKKLISPSSYIVIEMWIFHHCWNES